MSALVTVFLLYQGKVCNLLKLLLRRISGLLGVQNLPLISLE